MAEWNPGESELLPNFNFAPSLPGEHITGVGMVVGTSSDRIGTPDGRAWFGSLSLNPRAWGVEIPVSGYAGASYGTWENDLRAIGGVSWRVHPRFSVGAQHDGVNLHGVANYDLGELGPGNTRWSIGALLIEQDNSHTVGLTLGTRF